MFCIFIFKVTVSRHICSDGKFHFGSVCVSVGKTILDALTDVVYSGYVPKQLLASYQTILVDVICHIIIAHFQRDTIQQGIDIFLVVANVPALVEYMVVVGPQRGRENHLAGVSPFYIVGDLELIHHLLPVFHPV